MALFFSMVLVLSGCGEKGAPAETQGDDTVVDSGTPTDPSNVSGPEALVQSISLMSGSESVIADGSSTTVIRATVVDTNGDPAAGITVTFTTTLGTLNGTVPYAVVTDAQGIAQMTLQSATTVGTSSITATASGFSQTQAVAFISGAPTTVALVAAPSTVAPDGTSRLMATITDSNGNPVKGETIRFDVASNESGSALSLLEATTDVNGRAEVEYTAGTLAGSDTVTATTQNAKNGIINITVSSTAVVVKSIALETGSDRIVADGVTTTVVRATAMDTNGDPATGITVTFSASLGSLPGVAPYTMDTDVSGIAEITLRSAATVGTSSITATASGFSQTQLVAFISGAPTTVALVAAPLTVAPDGTSRLTATITDSNGNPVVGERIRFDISANNSDAALSVLEATTNVNGRAEVEYTAGTVTGLDTVTATTQNAQSGTTDITVSSTAVVVKSITLETGTDSIVADGATTTMIRATVMDTNGDPADGITVTFTTTLGTLDGAKSYTVDTDATGAAEITLRSATTVGTSSITATASGFSQTQLVAFISGAPTTVALVAAPLTVAPDGTSRLTATITDSNGNPVVGERIRFDISANNSDASLSLLEAATNVNGRAEVEYTAGTGTGLDTVIATTQNAKSGTIGITVSSTAVVVNSITLEAGSERIVADGATSTTIRATVMDTNGNPGDGITVIFSATLGSLDGVDPYTVVTDASGIAEITLRSATTVGISSITATASGFSQTQSVAFISGAPMTVVLVAAPSTVAPDGTSGLTATIADSNGNPVVGERIRFDISKNSSGADLSLIEATTNVNGRAEVEYTAGSGTGLDTVTATTSNAQSGTTDIIVSSTAVVVKSITLEAGSDSIVADEVTTTVVRATAMDTNGDPATGITVTFSASLGSLPGVAPYTVDTDVSGIAEITLRSAATVGTSSITATASGFSQTQLVAFISGPPSTVALVAAPLTVAPDGTSRLTATITDSNGNPVVGERIRFDISANNSGADLSLLEATTNVNGRADVEYTAGTGTGLDTVTVTTSNAQSGTTVITVSPTAVVVKSITLATGTDSIVADGATSTMIRATVMDTNGDPADGITVTFSASLGSLPGVAPYTVDTDVSGIAEITLQSATTVGTSSITATASGFSQTQLVAFISGEPMTVALVAAPPTVDSEGTSRLTATVTDSNGNPVVGETIRFDLSTNSSGARLSLLEAITNVNGRAEVEYTAGTGTGSDTVTATAENAIFDSVNITVDADLIIVQTVEVSSGANSIIAGTSTTIRAVIEDIQGDPARGVSVVFTATSGTLGVNPVTDENGMTEVTLTSTHNVGSSIVTATAGGISGSATVRFTAGPSDHMDIQASPVDVALGGQSTLIVTVYDKHNNCVPLTTVQLGFTVSDSGAPSLASAIGQTDDSGRFTTIYTAGTTTGTDTLHVRSGDVSGDVDISADPLNSTIGSLTLTSGSSEIVAGSGGSVGLRATVFDLDGDPVGGVSVLFTPGGAVVTDSEGIAESFYAVPTASGDVDVMASAGGFLKRVTLSFVPGSAEGAQSSITATPSTVPADGNSEIVVQVLLKDLNANLVANGTEVTLISSAGTITSLNPVQTISGRVAFTLQAPNSKAIADITIQEVSSTPSCSVSFGTTSDGAPASILLSAGDPQIYVAGVGQIETTTVNVQVLDSTGEPIDESNYDALNQDENNVRVSFLSSPGGGEYVSAKQADGTVVDTRAAGMIEARTTQGAIILGLHSGTLPGPVEIRVEAFLNQKGDDLTPPVGASLPQVSIASGSPHSITFSRSNLNAVIDLNNPANVGTEDGEAQTIPGFYRRSGAVSVTDRYGNDVPDGTTVNLGLIDSVISMGETGEIADDSVVLTDPAAGFQNATIIRNNTDRTIEVNDRMLLLDADSEDKSRMVADPIFISSTDIDAHAAYQNNKSDLHYVIGSNLLGAYISGTTPAGTKIKGTSVVQNGLAKFWVTYPADTAHILTGCYGYIDSSPLNYSPLDIRRDKPKSAQVYVVASALNGVTAIDQGNFGFASMAGWTLISFTDEISGTTDIEFELRDGGDEVLLPFFDIGYSVAFTENTGGMTIAIPGVLRTDAFGKVIVPVTVTGGASDDAATITFGAGDARATVEVVIP